MNGGLGSNSVFLSRDYSAHPPLDPTMLVATCYLCGRPVAKEANTEDHVVPRVLLSRKQPRVKGFDYGGSLPTHAQCNNGFGPESYVAKALDLVDVLHKNDCWFEYRHPADPGVRMMALNSACLPTFTKRDLRFFRILDTRGMSTSRVHDLSILRDQQPVDPKRHALFTALAVLTKSAAALLVSRRLGAVPPAWDVLAVPYVGDADAFNFDGVFGQTLPFDLGVKVWVGHLETGDFLVVYRAKRIIIYFLFRFCADPAAWNRMLSRFAGATRLHFRSHALNDLMTHAWKTV